METTTLQPACTEGHTFVKALINQDRTHYGLVVHPKCIVCSAAHPGWRSVLGNIRLDAPDTFRHLNLVPLLTESLELAGHALMMRRAVTDHGYAYDVLYRPATDRIRVLSGNGWMTQEARDRHLASEIDALRKLLQHSSIHDMGVVTLQRGNRLGVWVEEYATKPC